MKDYTKYLTLEMCIRDSYQLAQRLIELLKFVLPIPSETVPKTSILREFIGGSYFE